VYDGLEDPSEYRVLVDRIWPRGVRKADARLSEWLKDVAPSTELRRWYGHEPARFEEFARRYRAELGAPPASAALAHLDELAHTEDLTLLTATRDVEHSAARVLRERLHRAAPLRGRAAVGAPGAARSRGTRPRSAHAVR
jgi:uncharacterized protein YeaO (DUF488 family)